MGLEVIDAELTDERLESLQNDIISRTDQKRGKEEGEGEGEGEVEDEEEEEGKEEGYEWSLILLSATSFDRRRETMIGEERLVTGFSHLTIATFTLKEGPGALTRNNQRRDGRSNGE